MIEEYRFGTMRVRGREYHGDLKIVNDEVVDGWWRKEGHEVAADDIMDILVMKPRCLVVGTGQPGRMRVAESLKAVLLEAGIELVEEPTAEAVRTFNRLRESGGFVAGAFHLTC